MVGQYRSLTQLGEVIAALEHDVAVFEAEIEQAIQCEEALESSVPWARFQGELAERILPLSLANAKDGPERWRALIRRRRIRLIRER
ncbi:MAG: hypothetical protein HY332_19935 [Chloroflexi bacterium]|nr:hypothetical protein [Chloroflexota bacterium]